jgi:dephospho-CoA kinase
MRIGLTGGVGCGVTEVAKRLHSKGVRVISGDQIGYQALKTPQVKNLLIQQFGPEILDEGGEVDRDRLGNIVFSDPEALRDLNRIIHPTLLDMLQREVAAVEAESGTAVVDAALIFEWGLQGFFHKIIVVDAPLELRIQRTMQRSGLSREHVIQRIRSQRPLEQKMEAADIVIVNDGTLENLHHRVDEVWEEIIRS